MYTGIEQLNKWTTEGGSRFVTTGVGGYGQAKKGWNSHVVMDYS